MGPTSSCLFRTASAIEGSAAGFNAAVTALAGQGAVVQSIAIGDATCSNGSIGTLQEMADGTGGSCFQVTDPNSLPNIIPDLISSSLDSLSISTDGGASSTIDNADINPDLPQAGPANVTYNTSVANLGTGFHTFCVTAVGHDVGGSGDSGPACVKVDLLQIGLAPASATNELGTSGQTHTVTATIAGGSVAGRTVTFEITAGPNAGATGVCAVNADCTTDAAGQVSWTYEAKQGLAGLGTDTIKASFTLNDPTGVTGSAEVTKEWVDTTPPVCACEQGVNPAGNIPAAPGNGGHAQNPDGFYLLTATDAVDPNPQIFVTDGGSGTVFGPFPSGTNIKYVQAPGAEPSIEAGTGAVDWMIKGTGDVQVTAVDSSGNVSDPINCLVPPPPK